MRVKLRSCLCLVGLMALGCGGDELLEGYTQTLVGHVSDIDNAIGELTTAPSEQGELW